MANNVDCRWLANVLARVENQPSNQPVLQGRLTQTNRDKECLIVNGFQYKKGRVINGGATQNWRCVKFTCNGSAKTSFGSIEGLNVFNQHICRQSPNAFSRREVISAVKSAAISNFGSSSTDIVSAAKRNLTDYELLALPTDRGLQDRAQRKKKPVGANSVDKPVNEIVWLEYFSLTERGNVFLRHDSRLLEPDFPVMFLFLSASGLQLLQENSRWSIDATFYSAPPQFSQLYTVNVFKCESTLPCAYALLPDKTASTYSRLFNVLKNFRLQPQSVMTDFEISAINALEDVYGSIAVDFCLFHLSKNAFANIQNKHLHAAYEHDKARTLLRCLPALAFPSVQRNEIDEETIIENPVEM